MIIPHEKFHLLLLKAFRKIRRYTKNLYWMVVSLINPLFEMNSVNVKVKAQVLALILDFFITETIQLVALIFEQLS